jgi:hypothetical protein
MYFSIIQILNLGELHGREFVQKSNLDQRSSAQDQGFQALFWALPLPALKPLSLSLH